MDCSPPGVDCNTALMIERDNSIVNDCPKFEQCWRKFKPLRPFGERSVYVFFDCINREEMKQVAPLSPPPIDEGYNEV